MSTVSARHTSWNTCDVRASCWARDALGVGEQLRLASKHAAERNAEVTDGDGSFQWRKIKVQATAGNCTPCSSTAYGPLVDQPSACTAMPQVPGCFDKGAGQSASSSAFFSCV